MNHPYPRNLPLLREMYFGRFTYIRFLMPFERLDDPDVFTVYRGSYTHAGYITDARAQLEGLDCDYFIFCHDDVILNPQLSELTFSEIFPIGPHDGFISHVASAPAHIGDWAWYLGMIPKLFHSKSMLFGGGIEYRSLVNHFPGAQRVEDKLIENKVAYAKTVSFKESPLAEIVVHPPLVILDGYHKPVDGGDPRQVRIGALCLNICHDLIESVKLSSQISGMEHAAGDDEGVVDLPIPLANAGFFTDFYILPKSRLAEYAHYVGVASAANLFVEVMAPTLLLTCCDKVWQAEELGLDVSGFYSQPGIDAFRRRKLFAIHPFKMAAMTAAAKRELLSQLRGIAGEDDPGVPMAIPGGADGSLFDLQAPGARGWHEAEPWGSWASEPSATIGFHYDDRVALKKVSLSLCLPTHPRLGRLSGAVVLNGRRRRFSATFPDNAVEVSFSGALLKRNALNVIEIISDTPVRPAEVEPGIYPDQRRLGVGLKRVVFS